MVEYDEFGLPKTREYQELKQQLGWTEKDVNNVQGEFIPNPEWMLHERHHKDTDIEVKDMDPETKELNEVFELDEDVVEGEEEDVFGDDFILQLNGGVAPLQMCEDGEEMKEEGNDVMNIDPLGLMKGFMPSGMSGEAQ